MNEWESEKLSCSFYVKLCNRYEALKKEECEKFAFVLSDQWTYVFYNALLIFNADQQSFMQYFLWIAEV